MIRKYSNGLRLWLILVLLAVPGGASAALAAPAAVNGAPFSMEGAFFTHLTNSLSVSGGSSGFYQLLANNNSSAVVLETQNWTAPGTPNILAYDPHPIGLAFNSVLLGSSYWSVINEDAAAMPLGIGFNLAAISNTSRAFTVIANTGAGGNTNSNVTIINNPLTDGHPEVMPMISQVYNPAGGLTGIYNADSVGVYYTGTNWAIFNENQAPIPNGVAFNVYVPTGNVFLVSSTAANTSLGYDLVMNNPLLNNRPDALAFVTQVWLNTTGVYNDHEPGIWYTGNHKWAISNADITQLPTNASFFVWVPSDQDAALIQRSSAANIIASQSRLDDPRLNSDPNLLLLATQNFNPGSSAGVFNNSPISVLYNIDGHYRINNENGSGMPLGAAFNVYSPGITPRSLVQSVNLGLSLGNTDFSNPFLDNNPSAYLFITANDTPFGSPGVNDNHPTSVLYDGAAGYWSIVNTDGTTMPAGMAFNIFIPPDSMAPFTVVSSLSNTAGSTVYINNSRTNHHPEVALLATQVKTALSSHNFGVKYDPIQAEWGIMNEDGTAMAAGMQFNVLVLTPDTVYLPLIKH